MPLRFYRRLRLCPGLRVNFSKSGASLSVGHRGAWYTFGPRGQRRVTLGLPGSGSAYSGLSKSRPPGRRMPVIGWPSWIVEAAKESIQNEKLNAPFP